MLLDEVWFTQLEMLLRGIMPNEDRMTVDERRKYLKLVSPRYAKAGRVERSGLLTEMAAVTGLHRKSLLRLLHGPTLDRAQRRPRVRRRWYGVAVAEVVGVVWESLDYVCAERLTPALLPTAQQLAQWEEVVLTPDLAEQLGTISRATVQRLLQRFQQDRPKLPRRKSQPPAAGGADGAVGVGDCQSGQLRG